MSNNQEQDEERSGQTASIWDRFAKGYNEKPVADEASYQKKLKITQQYLKQHMDLLEFGCGTGSTSIVHAPFVKHILATDISPKMIEIATQKAKDAKVSNIDFRATSIDKLKLPNESQDVVLGLSILHLLQNRDDVIAKTYRWLKPGGLFVTSTACIGDMGWSVKAFVKTVLPVGRFFNLLPYVDALTKSELRESMTKAGFQIEYEWQPKEGAGVFMIGRKV